jgi:hypothetical protein
MKRTPIHHQIIAGIIAGAVEIALSICFGVLSHIAPDKSITEVLLATVAVVFVFLGVSCVIAGVVIKFFPAKQQDSY